MNIFRKLAGQTATYGLSSIFGRMLNYLLVPIYTRVFHAGEYGEVTQLYAYVSFLNVLFTYGLETAYFRFFATEKGNPKVYSTSLISIITSSLSLGLLIVLFSSPLARMLGSGDSHHDDLSKYISWFAGILVCDAIVSIPFARLRQENKAKRFVALRIINISVNVGLNVFFLLLCPKLLQHDPGSWVSAIYSPSLGVGYVFIINLFSSFITLLMLSPEIFRIHFEFDKNLWKTMMMYAMPLLIAGFAGMINETFDRILIPMLIADKPTAMAQLGIYGACYKVSILMTLFIQTFRYAAEPFFFSQATKDDAQKVYSEVMNYFIIICSFIFLCIMMYIDIVQYLIGKEFRSGLAIVPILLMANLCLGVYYNLSIWYKITGQTRWGAVFTMVGAGITLGFNFWLIPVMGYIGAAWATLFCYASMMILSYYIGQRHYPVPYNVRLFFQYILAAMVLYFISEFIRSYFNLTVIPMLTINTGFVMIYVAIVWASERKKINYLRRAEKM